MVYNNLHDLLDKYTLSSILQNKDYTVDEKIEESIRIGYDFNEILDNCRDIRILLIGNKLHLSKYFDSYSTNHISIVESVYRKDLINPNYDMIIYDNSTPEYEEDVNKEIRSLIEKGIVSLHGKKIQFSNSSKRILINSLEYVIDNFPMLPYYICINELIKRDIKIFYFSEPTVYKLEDKTKHEQHLVSQNFSSVDVLSDTIDYCRTNYPYNWDDLIHELIGDKYSESYLNKIKSGNKNKSIYLKDKLPYFEGLSEYCNFIDGIRFTTDAPKKYRNKIHIIGRSTIQGLRLEDSETVPSYLQRYVNKMYPESYKINNYSFAAIKPKDVLNLLLEIEFITGDIVILFGMKNSIIERQFLNWNSSYECDLQPLFQRPHSMGEIFFDPLHYNYKGCQRIADHVFNQLNEHNAFRIEENKKETFSLHPSVSTDIDYLLKDINFQNYLKEVKEKGKLHNFNFSKKIGAIVMNCNPFTLGHKWLIETALTKVDYLFIFIVEENSSEYTFKERMQLVENEFINTPNICIVGSGNYIISKSTFPEYFDKKNLQKMPVNPTNDVLIFSKYIAPYLNISTRFVGEEPLDNVTNQYNEKMKLTFPKYGIEFIVLKRITTDENVISASYVRSLLEPEKWKEHNSRELLHKLVTDDVYNFLVKRHSLL